MRILKLHHPEGHPYWSKDEYKIQLPNGIIINPVDYISDNFGGYRVYWNDEGVFVQICASGSGYGKVDRKQIAPVLLVKRSEYDKIEFFGKELIISDTLKSDLEENGLL